MRVFVRVFGLLLLLFTTDVMAQQRVLSGVVREQSTGEPMPYATVSIAEQSIGTVSDENGAFQLTVPEGEVTVQVTFVGYETMRITVPADHRGPLNFEVKESASQLRTVEVAAGQSRQRDELESTQMSLIHLPVKDLQGIPSIGGETDVIKVVQLLPGVAQGGEGTTALFVRGGDADQNLVLLDDAPLYNIGHLFGFYSVFNPDALESVTLLKGAFPVEYGGRLSSVLDIKTENGAEHFGVSGGIGLLSSRLTVKGPLGDGRTTYQLSGRRTYIDQLAGLVGNNIPYYFYDLNGRVSTKLSSKDRITFSTFYGRDVLKLGNQETQTDSVGSSAEPEQVDFGFTLSNQSNSLRWDHRINNEMLMDVTLIHTQFNYDINARFDDNSLMIQSDIRDLGVKAGINWYPSKGVRYRFGVEGIQHDFRPNVLEQEGDLIRIEDRKGERIGTQEVSVYGGGEWDVIPTLFRVTAGMRVSGLKTGSKTYVNPEPRLGLRYTVGENAVLKAGYSRMMQYMHLVSSSSLALPTDLWYPASDRVEPQRSEQASIGYSTLIPGLKTSFTVEGFYKWMYNLTEYREGSNLLLNDNFEDELLSGTGRSYGWEFLLRREEGRLTGWLGYTLAWSTRQYDELNGGLPFYARFDRRHNFSAVAIFKVSPRLSVSALWVYATGARFTAKTGNYLVPNPDNTGVDVIPIYSARNAIKLSSTHRLDLNVIWKNKPNKRFQGEWHVGAYNVYNRASPFRIDVLTTSQGDFQYQQPGLFGFVPSVAYNFKF